MLVLGAYLTGIGVANLVFTISTTTDENLFTDAPSTLYIVRSFQAKLEGKRGLPMPSRYITDSVQAGNLLVAVNGTPVQSTAQVKALLHADSTDSITLKISDLQDVHTQTYRVKRTLIPENFVRDIPPTAYVVNVYPGGASDQAGMKVGDLIVSINGQRFKNIFEADKIMRNSRVGATINYEILRDNRTRTLHITLARVRFTLPLFALFLCGLVYIGTGVFIGYKRPNLAAARLLALAFLCLGYLWLAFNNAGGSPPQILQAIRSLTFFPVIFFGIAFWYHSRFYFPAEQPLRLARPWLYRIPYILASLSTISCTVIIFIAPNPYGNFLLLAGGGILFLFIVATAIIYRKQVSAEYKRMDKPIRAVSSIAGATFGLLSLLSQYVPVFNAPWLPALMVISMLAIPLAYLYVIGRYKLLGLHLRVRRNIQYMAISTVWKASMLIIAFSTLYLLTQLNLDVPNLRFTGTAMEIPREPISLQERVVLEKITLMIAAVCFTFAFWEVGRAGQNFINRMYYRSEYDYKQASMDFADVIATRLALPDLCPGIVQKLADSVHLKRVGLFIFREHTLAYYTDNQAAEAPDVSSRECIEAFQQFHGGFSVDYLPRSLKEVLRAREYMHLIPIRSKDSVIGALAIGEKMSEAAVEREDLAFLEAVSRQAAVAIENAFLYEEIAQQDRLRHELALAREIQLASLPQTTPDIPGLDIAGMSCPALEVGGDYFDYLNGSPDSITVIVGDVSGKGTSAALYMSKVQGILRSLHAFNLSPRELLVRTNQLLYNDLEKKGYVTTLSANFDTNTRHIQVARAGHLPLLHFRAGTGIVDRILPKGLGLGMVATAAFSPRIDEESIHYETGDIFLFVTDGITEAMNIRRQEFGEDQLLDVLRAGTSVCAQEIRDRICSAVQAFTGEAALHDDFTVVVVKAV